MVRRRQGREVVYVERGGDASAKWLFWGAVLGRRPGADVRAAERRGNPPGPAAQAVEAARHDRGEAGRDRPAVRRPRRKSLEDLAEDDRRPRRARGPPRCVRGPPVPRLARSWSGAWPRRARGAGARRGYRGAARLKRPRPGGWHRSPAGFLRRTLTGRRRKQHSVSRQRAHLRRAAGRHSLHPAAADRPDPPGPGHRRRARWIPPTCSTASSRRMSTRPVAIRSSVIEPHPRPGSRGTGASSRCTPCRRSSGSAPGSSPGSEPR